MSCDALRCTLVYSFAQASRICLFCFIHGCHLCCSLCQSGVRPVLRPSHEGSVTAAGPCTSQENSVLVSRPSISHEGSATAARSCASHEGSVAAARSPSVARRFRDGYGAVHITRKIRVSFPRRRGGRPGHRGKLQVAKFVFVR